MRKDVTIEANGKTYSGEIVVELNITTPYTAYNPVLHEEMGAYKTVHNIYGFAKGQRVWATQVNSDQEVLLGLVAAEDNVKKALQGFARRDTEVTLEEKLRSLGFSTSPELFTEPEPENKEE